MAKNDFPVDEMPDYESDNQAASYTDTQMPDYADDNQELSALRQEDAEGKKRSGASATAKRKLG